MQVVRSRLNGKFANMNSPSVITNAFIAGVEPLLKYLIGATSRAYVTSQGKTAVALHTYELFKIVAQRTRLSKRYADVIDYDDNWVAVESGLALSLAGERVAAPPLESGADPLIAEWELPVAVTCAWWAGRRVFSVLLGLSAPVIFQLRGFLLNGRYKLYVSVASFCFLVLSLVFWRYGPDILPGCVIVGQPLDALDDGTRSEVSETQESPSTPARIVEASASAESAPSAAIDKLTSEMMQLRSMMLAMSPTARETAARLEPQTVVAPSGEEAQSAQLAALLNFATNQQAQGPISGTAAQHWGAQGMAPPGLSAAAPVFTPGPLPAHPSHAEGKGGGYNPFLAGAQLAKQVDDLCHSLATWEAQKSLNGLWGVHFWQDVTKYDTIVPLAPELRTVLMSHGYVGPGSLGTPRPGLRAALCTLKDKSTPQMGTGVTGLPGFGEPAPPAQQENDRWEYGLAPDLQRGAPEIYRSMRSEGVANMREWVNLNYKGDREATCAEWVDLWAAATEIDFAVGSTPHAQVPNMLGTSDAMEIKLRRLGAYRHYWRTGDAVAFARVLAVKPPGMNTDVLPDWLVEDATKFSSVEHSRAQRVRDSRSTPKGAPKGKDPKGRGRGRGDGAGLPPEDAGDAARGRGRGRGRGRK